MMDRLRGPFLFSAKGLFFSIVLVAMPGVVHAGGPRIEFDVGYTAGCRDVTTEEFAAANPDLKIVEARFLFTALIREGDERDVIEMTYSISSPAQRLSVAGFSPSTELHSEIEGQIKVVEENDEINTREASLAVTGAGDLGPIDLKITPHLGGAKTRQQSVQETYSRLPPKQLLLAAGTENRGHGVFFKLKPSSQASLEGQREFRCRFIVPRQWSADYVLVACRAKGYNRHLWKSVEDVGGAVAFVGLYLEGDAEAREAAVRISRAYEAYRLTRLQTGDVPPLCQLAFNDKHSDARQEKARQTLQEAFQELSSRTGW